MMPRLRLATRTWRSPRTAPRRARSFGLIQRLDPLDRQVMLAYLEDLDAESIAEITGLSVTNVWSKIHRIKNVLVHRFREGGRNAL